MTSPIDICNRALSEIGTRSTIADFSEGSTEASACALWYDHMRQQLLRAAPWGFSRAQKSLSALGSWATQTSPYPWGFKYTYPPGALKVHYILPPNPVADSALPVAAMQNPWCRPSRENRFIVASDTDPSTLTTRKVLLSNLADAQCVYTIDETNPDLFDPQFSQALTAAIAAKIVIALTGNAGMRAGFIQSAMDAVTAARVSDGNEAMPTTDHTPDWMAVRGYADLATPYATSLGLWYVGYDSISWGM